MLALLLASFILLYGVYTASWQRPWGSGSRAERQSVQVSTAVASPTLHVLIASQQCACWVTPRPLCRRLCNLSGARLNSVVNISPSEAGCRG